MSSVENQTESQWDVLVLMGSQTDASIMEHVCVTLKSLGISYSSAITSAHRTPERLLNVVSRAEEDGYKVIIAGAGGSAHLPGMSASETILPVLGVAVPSSSNPLNDTAAMGSMIAMPTGVPLAYMGLGKAAAINAAVLAAGILAIGNPGIRERLRAWREAQTKAVPLKPEFKETPTESR